ncbi:hypothetical protein AB0E08_29050 [Streptomyces sp. NPDC048281]|uniref:hypothetical protein n=1 Tax=Streptomyces sp. NPDC048281 TaxID=3154715 RepID=UPI003437BA26
MNATANTSSEPAQEPLRDVLVAILEAIPLASPGSAGRCRGRRFDADHRGTPRRRVGAEPVAHADADACALARAGVHGYLQEGQDLEEPSTEGLLKGFSTLPTSRAGLSGRR